MVKMTKKTEKEFDAALESIEEFWAIPKKQRSFSRCMFHLRNITLHRADPFLEKDVLWFNIAPRPMHKALKLQCRLERITV